MHLIELIFSKRFLIFFIQNGIKRKLNQSTYEELIKVLEWSKELSNEDLNSAKAFYKEKDKESLDSMIMGGILGGVQEHEENLSKAKSIQNEM